MQTDSLSLDDNTSEHVINKKLLSVAFFALCIMVFTAPIAQDASNNGTAASAAEGNPVRQLGYVFILIIIMFGSGIHRDLRGLSVLPVNIRVVLAYCWLSVAWAIDPSIATRRLALTTIVALSVAIVVRSLGVGRTIAQIRVALLLAIVASYVAVLLFPNVGVHQFEANRDVALIGNWRGIYPEKNFMGAVCAMTVLTFYFGEQKRFLVLRWIVIVASFAFLVKTESKTSIALVLVALSSGLAFRVNNYRNWPVAFVTAIFIAFSLSIILLWYGESLISPLDREDTLTGRSQIWRILIAYIGDHWLLGAGYGSFWYIGDLSPVYDYAKGGSWFENVTHGHNGYLDIASQIGVPGLFMAVYLLLIKPIATLLSHPGYEDRNGAMYLAIFVFCVGHNFTESTLLARDHILQFMIVVVICMIETVSSVRRTPQI